jgi:hypothetical protein
MRALPTGMAATLAGGEAGLATVWLLTRTDAVRLGFTDHDEDLPVDGVACAAGTGWTFGAGQTGLGAKAGEALVTGALDSAAITEPDIAAGLYDGAQVECRRVLWSDPTQAVLLWRGTVVRMARDGAGFTAEIAGPLQALARVVGRTYGRACDAVLGDARCRAVVTSEQLAAGCDKSFATCRDAFANAINFQGFADIPGDDFIAATPVSGGQNDGGSRR